MSSCLAQSFAVKYQLNYDACIREIPVYLSVRTAWGFFQLSGGEFLCHAEHVNLVNKWLVIVYDSTLDL